MKHPDCIGGGARSQQRPSRFHQIARPYQVISAQIFIALAESPRNRQAGNNAAQEILGLMCAQHSSRRSVEIVRTLRLIQFDQRVLPVSPVEYVMLAKFVVILEQAGANLLPRFTPHPAEAERQNELSI